MTWRYVSIVALAGLGPVACGGGDEEPAAAPPAAPAAQEAPPAAPEPDPPVPQGQAAEAGPTVEPAAAAPIPDGLDEPWFPTDTGTVDPGWTVADVVAVWGEPVLQRTAGDWTFLYYRNGCEHACGTFDIVLLERDQVVDAIVRGPGHTYSGVSSSPPGRIAEFTPPISPPDTNRVIG